MDECTGKRAAAGFGLSRRGSNLAFRDPNHEDRSIQYCNRIGCSTRLNPMKGTQIVNPDKAKYSRVSFRSMSSKATAGSMSRPFSVSSDFRKPHRERQNRTSLQVAAVAESSSRQGEIEDLGHRTRHEETEVSESSSGQGGTEDMESSPTTTGMQTVLPNPGDLESAILQGFSADASEELGSCTTSSNSRTRKQINQRLGSENQDTSSSVRRSFASRNTSQAGKPVSLGLGAGVQRYGLKNLSCTSISDVLPSGCSSSDSGHNRRVDAVRKRSSDGESSSARGKGISVPSSRRNSDSSHTALSGPNSSPSERLIPQQASRRARTRPTTRDGVASVRTRRPTSGDTSMRLLEQEDDNSLSLPERIMIPQLPQTQFSIAEVVPESSSRSLPLELPPLCHNTLGRPGSSSRTAQRRPISRPEDISTQMFHGPLGDRDGYRRLNMEGIAEVLLALERIEQDEELTYEQLLVLETNLFLGGLNFHDQHRDMRLDIDNMSYEELLDLEEKMGNVSTALSEEALSRCLKRSIYVPASFFSGIAGHGDDDIKCSICQEEYAVGDEMGKLGCEHRYHVACIDQWLRQKNWCPICKVAASPSQHPHN